MREQPDQQDRSGPRPNRSASANRWLAGVVVASSVATVVAAALAGDHALTVAVGEGRFAVLGGLFVLYGLFFILIGSNIAYYLCQLASLRHARRGGLGEQDAIVPGGMPAWTATGPRRKLLILVPSFKEEPDVIRLTLASAALVEYPGRRVVLLIDDPPRPANGTDEERLRQARRIPEEIAAHLAPMADRLSDECLAWRARAAMVADGTEVEAAHLAALHAQIADWLESLADRIRPGLAGSAAHGDRLFRARILHEPASAHRRRARALLEMAPDPARIAAEYDRLERLFRVELSSFERKRYANLSHAPNKAMNLNSYIGLIGGDFALIGPPDAPRLIPAVPAAASLRVPPADYIVTVDADSLIMADYAIRLVHIMEQPGNERIAVAQTPYTSVPDAPGRLERAAAASTDAQFFTHQGMAAFGASVWVGASALLRFAALRDIVRTADERGFKVPVFIDDRILIEDAAATVDLLARGWRIHHACGRLSYSATPADFGTLVIQRRRWANGGLLILPRLLRHALAAPRSWRKAGDALLRSFNLMSAALSGVGMTVLLLFPFDPRLVPAWMPLVALPYYLMLGCDLTRAGYRWRDLPNVFALTILLVPVNLAGTLQSIRQAWTGRPIPFRRTPKEQTRTRTPPIYVLALYGIVVASIGSGLYDALAGCYGHMLFATGFFLGATHGLFGLIGARQSWDDLVTDLRQFGRMRAVPAGMRAAIRGRVLARPQ